MLKQFLPGTILKGFRKCLSRHGSLWRLNLQRETGFTAEGAGPIQGLRVHSLCAFCQATNTSGHFITSAEQAWSSLCLQDECLQRKGSGQPVPFSLSLQLLTQEVLAPCSLKSVVPANQLWATFIGIWGSTGGVGAQQRQGGVHRHSLFLRETMPPNKVLQGPLPWTCW